MSNSETSWAGRELLDVLVENAYVSASVRSMLQNFMKRWSVSAYHALLLTEVLDEPRLTDALGECLGVDRLFNVQGMAAAEAANRAIGFRRAREWECIAVQSERMGDTQGGEASCRIELVIADPTRHERIALLRRELACEMTLAVAELSDIVGAIDELYPLADQLPSLFKK